MRRFLVFPTVAFIVLASATLLEAQPRRGTARGDGRGPAVSAAPARPQGSRPEVGRRRVGGPDMPALGRGLNLTDDQRAKVRDITRAGRDKTAPLTDQLRLAQSTLRRETFADAPNASTVDDLAAKVTDLRAQIAGIRLQTTRAIAEVLTAEQRATMRTGVGRGFGRGAGAGPFRGRGGDRGRNG